MSRGARQPLPGEARRRRYDALCILLVLTLIVLAYSQATIRSVIGGGKAGEGASPARKPKMRSSCAAAGEGEWVRVPGRVPLYDSQCRFHRNAWNCGKNRREGLQEMNEWVWRPRASCRLPPLHPPSFLASLRGMSIGFVGDSLNENMLVSLLCIFSRADPDAIPWKRRKAWRGAYFPAYNVTVAYHRAVLLADYRQWKPTDPTGPLEKLGYEKGYQVNVDTPASEWINITKLYDVLIFNTGHWWGLDKFPIDNPLLFFKHGEPITPPLNMRAGLELVLENMLSYIEKAVPSNVLKIWRLQSPRHFEGGEWNQNGSCLNSTLLSESQLEEWFKPEAQNVNREAREVNAIITKALQGSSFEVLNISHMSEFRQDAHPAVWLGQKNAHIIWGQDCMHWCLPGVPDTWVHILLAMILESQDLPFTG